MLGHYYYYYYYYCYYLVTFSFVNIFIVFVYREFSLYYMVYVVAFFADFFLFQ